ncbi:uncharacterized protein BJ212DRAFT_1299227 [Suillus subaureus]|uniref:Uncharacterized protein n=1 Tax=Suillus subaureus TaxID=48587 RepID=A0A9P7JEJ6_9AGAM|nr:uncharacterized protein BJ212DRAFT_1299227 [Suillus subaureus]KAG1817732.1 hypothetical protein BJ212DRAFT_1299227 [Suillus subaureus]
MVATDGSSSGSGKGQIYSVIAKLVFMDHIKYGPAYSVNPKKFRNAVCNHIRICQAPRAAMVHRTWHSNLSMAAKVHSSRPGIDHTGAFYSLIRPHGGAGPSMYYGPSQHSSHTPNVSNPPSAYQPGPCQPPNEICLLVPFPSCGEEVSTSFITLSSSLPSKTVHHAIKNSGIHIQQPLSVWCPNAIKLWGVTQSATSLPHSASGLKKKKAKLNVLQQVEQDRHQPYIIKLKAKSEHNCDIKKYDWLRTTQEHKVSQATVSYQRLQEAKDTQIWLHETDIQVHQAHSLVLDKEAEILCLKIQFHQMMQASKATSDGETG